MDFDDLFEHCDDDGFDESGENHEESPRQSVENDEQDRSIDKSEEQEGSTAKTVQPKKKRQGTRLTLDHSRLCGERGIPVLPKHFENVKFKGKGHEKENLTKLMFNLEHWGHRLFPRLTFDDILDRVEWLGSKKPVKNCLTKIRLDMPLLSEDFVNRDEVEKENDIEQDTLVTEEPPDNRDQNPSDLFDQFLQEYESGNFESKNNQEAEMSRSDDANEVMSNEIVNGSDTLGEPKQPLPQSVLERIEKNRKLAEERRKARMKEKLQEKNDTDIESPEVSVNQRESESSIVMDSVFNSNKTHALRDVHIEQNQAEKLLNEDDLLTELENV